MPTSWTIWAVDDEVIVRWDSRATACDGQPYANSYAYFITIRDGRATALTMVLDMGAFDDVWNRCAPPTSPPRHRNAPAMLRDIRTIILALALGLSPAAGSKAESSPSPPPEVKLWRLDCGSFNAPTAYFSDLFAHPDQRADYVDSCYLVRHGTDLLLWDTGLSRALIGQRANPFLPIRMTLIRTVVDQLAALGLKPADVTIVALSHNHSDHTGQAADFPSARLLMASVDFEALRQTPAPFFTDPSALSPWLTGDGKQELVAGDHDVFSDGTVVMVALPGHTAGNYGLLVRLAHGGPVLISGDAIHSPSQLTTRAVPPSNPSRADSLASIDRIIGIVRDAHATLVIEHDPASVAKLPAFPQAAE